MQDNNIEMPPGMEEQGEEHGLPPDQNFEKSFEEGVPKFAGENPGNGDENTGVAEDNNEQNREGDNNENYDKKQEEASRIVDLLDAISREIEVETVIQRLKNFDASGKEDPIRALYEHMGIDTSEEREQVEEEDEATKAKKQEFRAKMEMPLQKRSVEGVMKAIADMKELITEVEGANPKYQKLRDEARAAGKGYFEYAVSKYGKRGLVELFEFLSEQRETEDQDSSEI